MTARTPMIGLPYGRTLTRADLQDLPEDDGHRYELIDGVLLVSPALRARHQAVVRNLHLLLRAACTPDLQVFLAPPAVPHAADTGVQPRCTEKNRISSSAHQKIGIEYTESDTLTTA